MSEIWQLSLSLVAAILCAATGATLAMLSFAIATYRFKGVANGVERPELPPTAKFFIYNSEKAAATISIGRRFFFAAAAFFTFSGAIAAFELAGIETSALTKLTLAFFSAIFAIFLQYCLADLPAAALASEYSESVLRKLSVPFYILFALFAPLEYPARKLSQKIYGKKFFREAAVFDYIDVEVMLRAEESDTDSISPYAGKIVRNAIRLKELDVSDVMLPRSQVEFLDIDGGAEINIAKAKNTRHTRYPICKEDLDNCLGVINIKDILNIDTSTQTPDFAKLARETVRFKEREKLETALVIMLRYKLHLALVEDEFGGVIGVLTLDSVLSELVGEIRDEFDSDKSQTIRAAGKNKYIILGNAPLRKVEDFLNIDFDTDEVSTFGGLITFSLGRFPEKGERLRFKEQKLRVRIDKVEERAVSECFAEFDDADSPEDIDMPKR